MLTEPSSSRFEENGRNLEVVTWRLINSSSSEKLIAVITYTMLSSERSTPYENEVVKLIENSLIDADLILS